MNIEINETIESKAILIIINKEEKALKEKQKQDYINLCIKAEICPICAKKLLSQRKYKDDKNYTEITCSKSKTHFKREIDIWYNDGDE